ncbi:hypothetical protein CDD83_6396 [Cordyceps sp. RAO-2017]|nr:hypothetical protein CDD83_6396 [Cordyceps sp. RAO-2017]
MPRPEQGPVNHCTWFRVGDAAAEEAAAEEAAAEGERPSRSLIRHMRAANVTSQAGWYPLDVVLGTPSAS